MSVREDLDHRIDSGRPPSFVHIKCTDVPLFTGHLKETIAYYRNLCEWPQVALGMYRNVLIILDVRRI
jgi:hypothetical protein